MDQIVDHGTDPADRSDRTKTISPTTKKRRRFPWLTMLVLLLLCAGAAWYWTRPTPAPTPAPDAGRGTPVQAVGVAAVVKADIPIIYDGLGTVVSLATVTVKTQINGQLTEIGFKEGQIVKKGDFLAQIDPRPYEVALEQAQGALAKDEALLKDAQIDLVRYQKLNQQDSIARQQLDTQQALVHQDEGTVQADKGQVDSAKLNLSYCHIVSPIDGRTGLRMVDAGNYLQTSDSTGLVVITQLNPISVIFSQPEDRIAEINQRVREGATLEVSVYDRSGQRQIAQGAVATIDNQIDTTTGTVRLRAMFPNDDLALFPNQFVNVRLLVNTMKDATVVPTAAIQMGARGPFVYAVNADNTVSVKQLKLAAAAGDRTAVLSGVEAGDQVVIDGVDRLRQGARVRIVAGQQSGSAPPSPDGQAPSGSDSGAKSNAKSDAAPAADEAGGTRKRRGRGQPTPDGQAPGAADSAAKPDPAAVADPGNGAPKHRQRDQPAQP
jgi:multidrug efflux system membrane fusion protein